MITFVLGIFVCWAPFNCEWRTVGGFTSEAECHSIGASYARDATVSSYKCVVGMIDSDIPLSPPVRR
jgi:hypothetical protein